jgi:hypothetical protein
MSAVPFKADFHHVVGLDTKKIGDQKNAIQVRAP